MNALDDEGVARTRSNLDLDWAFADMVKHYRTYCVNQEDPVLQSYKKLVDDIRQLNLKFEIKGFVDAHEATVAANREVKVEGQT